MDPRALRACSAKTPEAGCCVHTSRGLALPRNPSPGRILASLKRMVEHNLLCSFSQSSTLKVRAICHKYLLYVQQSRMGIVERVLSRACCLGPRDAVSVSFLFSFPYYWFLLSFLAQNSLQPLSCLATMLPGKWWAVSLVVASNGEDLTRPAPLQDCPCSYSLPSGTATSPGDSLSVPTT